MVYYSMRTLGGACQEGAFMVKHKSPINRSIIIGCAALIVALSLLLSLQTRMGFSYALYE